MPAWVLGLPRSGIYVLGVGIVPMRVPGLRFALLPHRGTDQTTLGVLTVAEAKYNRGFALRQCRMRWFACWSPTGETQNLGTQAHLGLEIRVLLDLSQTSVFFLDQSNES